MTCIVGYVDKETNSTFLGGDSAGVNELSISIRKDPKVFKNGEFIIGCTTSFRMIQLLRYAFTPPKNTLNKDIYEYMCTDFVNEIREVFKSGGFLQKFSDGDEKGGTFLVAYRNRLFRIENDFAVGENVIGIDAVGCGDNYAMASLFTIKDEPITGYEKINKSLEAAEFFSAGVARPFIILNTSSNE